MENWILQNLPLDNTKKHVILENVGDGTITIPVSTLTSMLGTAVPPTHSDLSKLPIASQGGWQKYFDAWKAAGYIQ